MSKILKRAILDALGTAVYVLLVSSFMAFLQAHFANHSDTLLTGVSVLLLLVCSAAITGFLVFGKPLMLYLDGKKKEAVTLVGYTIGILVIITIIVFSLVISIS